MLAGLASCSVRFTFPLILALACTFYGTEIEFISSYLASLNTALNNFLEKQVENTRPKTFSDLTQGTVIGNSLIQVISQVPAVVQVEINHFHQLLLRTDTFKEGDQLQFEEYHRVNGCSANRGIQTSNRSRTNSRLTLASS